MAEDDQSLRPWQKIVSPEDRKTYASAGYGRRAGWGKSPALLIIDVTYAFTGDRPEPISESIKRFPNSCGDVAWKGIKAIGELLKVCRESKTPIIYTAAPEDSERSGSNPWERKHDRVLETGNAKMSGPSSIVREIAPEPEDLILKKTAPSAFFGTPIVSHLVRHQIDTLVVTGCTTSGCVRASVIDAFSYNYKVAVVEEAVFDRGELSHLVNLWDMNAKYSDVVSLESSLRHLRESRLRITV